MAKVRLKNKAGVVKEATVGFSWTTFFFGGWVAMFRGHWGEVLKWVFLNPITFGIWGLIQCWTANKKTIHSLLERGYEPASEDQRELLVERNIVA
ncbi:hypothetical protein V1498_01775 [Peribacillus sp. SCS-26]|uniref:hypothetical protein n=1 Tax=Paraperibacillus marinus TaxID=3115295 RepID=UPI003906215A